MKRMILSISLMLALAFKVQAAGNALEVKPVKDFCLLDINMCEGNFRYDIHEKIKRLNIAIKLGETLYTPEELQHLKNIRNETRESFDFDNNDFMYEE